MQSSLSWAPLSQEVLTGISFQTYGRCEGKEKGPTFGFFWVVAELGCLDSTSVTSAMLLMFFLSGHVTMQCAQFSELSVSFGFALANGLISDSGDGFWMFLDWLLLWRRIDVGFHRSSQRVGTRENTLTERITFGHQEVSQSLVIHIPLCCPSITSKEKW